MKQIKFLTTISLEGKPIWFKDCIYQVMSETDDMYKIISEDLTPRGIDKRLKEKMYKIIEIEDKKNEKSISKTEDKVLIEKTQAIRKPRKTAKK